jgi:hypothetical protein
MKKLILLVAATVLFSTVFTVRGVIAHSALSSMVYLADSMADQRTVIYSACAIFKDIYVDKMISDDGFLIVRDLDKVLGLEQNLWLGWKLFPGTIVPDWDSAKVCGTKVEMRIAAEQDFNAYSGVYVHPELPPHKINVSQRLIIDIIDRSLHVAYKIPKFRKEASRDIEDKEIFEGDGVVLYYELAEWDLVAVEGYERGELIRSTNFDEVDFAEKAKEIIGGTFVFMGMPIEKKSKFIYTIPN